MKTRYIEDTMTNQLPQYSIAKTGNQADGYTKTTRAIGDHVGQIYGHEMKMLVLQLEETTWIEPTLKKEATRQEELKWGKEYDMILKKRDRYDEQKGKVFALLMNQCDEPVKNKIDGHEDYAKAEKDRDVIALLVKIKTVTHDANEKKYPPQQAVKSWKQLAMTRQAKDEDITAYYKRFKDLVENMEHTCGKLQPIALAEMDPKYAKAADATKEKMKERERQKVLAYLLMEGAHRGFAPLLRDLESDYALGQAKFPKTMEEALEVMSMYTEQTLYKTIMKKISKHHKQDENDTIEELSFAQMTKRDMIKKGLCFKCKKHGHRARECPNDDDTNDDETPEQQHMQQDQQAFGWMR